MERPRFATALERSYASATVEMYHQQVYNHSNGVVVVGLAPSHPALQPPRVVTAVRFDGGKRNLAHTEVKGKRKRGGVFMQQHDRLCDIELDDGSVHTIRACVRGYLVEVNDRLAAEPAILADASSNFVAVFMPKEADRITGDKGLIQTRLLARVEAERVGREAGLERERLKREERALPKSETDATARAMVPTAASAPAAAAEDATPAV
jgi:hypothetical protein